MQAIIAHSYFQQTNAQLHIYTSENLNHHPFGVLSAVRIKFLNGINTESQ